MTLKIISVYVDACLPTSEENEYIYALTNPKYRVSKTVYLISDIYNIKLYVNNNFGT